MTKTRDVYKFSHAVKQEMKACKSMMYKYDWKYRFQIEKATLHEEYPEYKILETYSSRYSSYTQKETNNLIKLLQEGKTYEEIAENLNRTYLMWPIK
ncbi:hypothetical protein [Bacillus weihaiensis]|uniref:hypothetical protein n=1 Tax=Bacillus weihaiensis TaxID=1547283 RepID=UPI0023555E59|nr:hypothetical protein [Bacillus weihaiensis]